MQKITPTRVVGDPVSANNMNNLNADLDTLFKKISNENLSTTYNVLGQLEQIVDNENSITVNLDWGQINDPVPKLFIQEVGDPKKYTVTYSSSGYILSVVYA